LHNELSKSKEAFADWSVSVLACLNLTAGLQARTLALQSIRLKFGRQWKLQQLVFLQ